MKIPDIALGAIIGALIAALVSLLTIWLKDYLIPILNDKRSERKRRRETFKRYAGPIIFASSSLLYRIKEMFRRGNFLLESAPKNDFNEYKFISTLYRFCSLIGWIRASKVELSIIEVDKSEDFKRIENALDQFEKSLADGQHVEQSVLEQVSLIFNLNIRQIGDRQRKKIAIEVENKINAACFICSVDVAEQIPKEKKIELAKDVCDLICQGIGCDQIEENRILDNLTTAIKEMSRVEAFIYRDWQSAIGDLMLKKADKESNKKFDIIGYREFEAYYFSDDEEIQKWIKRVKKLFYNLDTSVENRFDDRVSQIRKIYDAAFDILVTFSRINSGPVDISKNSIEKLRQLHS